jgi:hypothetical protein
VLGVEVDEQHLRIREIRFTASVLAAAGPTAANTPMMSPFGMNSTPSAILMATGPGGEPNAPCRDPTALPRVTLRPELALA